MKVLCPACDAPIPAAHYSLESGWAKCEKCDEPFEISAVVTGFVPSDARAARRQRPLVPRSLLERTDAELLIHVPAEGFRFSTLGGLGFAIFWLAFIASWTFGAAGGFGGRPVRLANWVFASFSIPFWFAGLCMLATIAWSLWGKKSVSIDRNGMRTFQRCLVWSRARWIERQRLQQARHYQRSGQSGVHPSSSVEIVYDAGSFVLAVDTADEADWLIGEINGFIRALV